MTDERKFAIIAEKGGGALYSVEFYEKANGECDVENWLVELAEKAEHDKDAGIQYGQVTHHIDILSQLGTRAPKGMVEHLDDGIWELRPGANRVVFFHYVNGKFVLLHHFRKTTNKTPPREIQRAKSERADYLARQGGL